jgi:subtilisin-like proprotein convertase family protein
MEKYCSVMPYFLQVNNLIISGLLLFFIVGYPMVGQTQSLKLPPLDNQKMKEEELSNRKPGRAPSFAFKREVHITPDNYGKWSSLNRDEEIWQLEITSSNALSLNLGFTEFYLPNGAQLFLTSPSSKQRFGPLTIHDNELHNEFWSPVLPGETILLELLLPKSEKKNLALKITSVNHDFLGFHSILSGNCNVDIACEEGEPYRDIARSVAIYGIQGTNFCTGFLINNTANDCKPYFMTANHCGITSQSAPSVVVYWNYQNSFCRSGLPQNQGKGDGQLNEFNSGAILRASYALSDFTLLELDDPAPANSFFAGWDISNQPAQNTTVCIHHPSTSEKRISFNFDGTKIINYQLGDTPDPNGNHLMVENWEIGTTESGSSGAPLFNQQKRVIGQLHGGLASCSENRYDAFGWIYKSWNGGGTKQTSLKSWLNPLNQEVSFLNGKEETNCGYNFILTREEINACGSQPFPLELTLSSSFNGRVNISLSDLPEGFQAISSSSFGTPGGVITLLITPPTNQLSNQFTLKITASDGELSGSVGVIINHFNQPPSTPILEGIASGLNPLVKWLPNMHTTHFQLQVFNAENLLIDTLIEENSFRVPGLKPKETYVWRLRGINFCGSSPWTPNTLLETPTLLCAQKSKSNILAKIPDDSNTPLKDTIQIEETGILESISIIKLHIEHTYIGDLSANLIAPSGRKIQLFNQPGQYTAGFGCPGENLSIILSDSAQNAHDIFENTCEFAAYAISGSFQALEKLANLAGEQILGAWVLEITDHASGDIGQLIDWGITYCLATPKREITLNVFPDDFLLCDEDELDFLLSSNTSLDLLPPITIKNIENLPIEITNIQLGTSPKEGVMKMEGFHALPAGKFQFEIGFDQLYPFDFYPLQGHKPGVPETPILLQTNFPLFKWSSSNHAIKYLLEIARDSIFRDVIYKIQTIDTFHNTNQVDEEGTYYIKITAFNECYEVSSSVNSWIQSNPTSTKSNEPDEFKLFPNPAKDWLYITSRQHLEKGWILLFGIQGNLVKTIQVNDETNFLKINIADVNPGIYNIAFQSESSIFYRKIIIQR